MEELLTKLMIYATLFFTLIAALKIGSFYLLHKFTKELAYQNITKKQLKELKEKKNQQRIKQQLELEDILLRKEIEPYYLITKDLFNNAMKSRNLSHEQILYLKKIINDSLGNYINDFKYTRYKNDCHEIYSKISSSHISINDFKRIIQLIKSFEAQTDNTYLTIVNTEEERQC
jgi:hypothetical protein